MSWAEVYKAINNNLNKPLNEQLGIESDEIQALINTWFNKGFVKSVQRGTGAAVNGTKTEYETGGPGSAVTITIKEIDPNKAVVILDSPSNSVTTRGTSSLHYGGVTLNSLTSTQLTVNRTGGNVYYNDYYYHYYTNFTWQVIEFY